LHNKKKPVRRKRYTDPTKFLDLLALVGGWLVGLVRRK